jgi:hypothetical protein
MAMKNIGILFVCMAVCGAALFAQTDGEAGFRTRAVTGGVEITGYKGKGGDVIIPATIGGKAVAGMAAMLFSA